MVFPWFSYGFPMLVITRCYHSPLIQSTCWGSRQISLCFLQLLWRSYPGWLTLWWWLTSLLKMATDSGFMRIFPLNQAIFPLNKAIFHRSGWQKRSSSFCWDMCEIKRKRSRVHLRRPIGRPSAGFLWTGAYLSADSYRIYREFIWAWKPNIAKEVGWSCHVLPDLYSPSRSLFTAWWLTYPSEKYESTGMVPNLWAK